MFNTFLQMLKIFGSLQATSGSLTDKKFSTFAQFRAMVMWAYDMDLITFYEFYSMNMPIFMPSHLSKYLFQQERMNMMNPALCTGHFRG